VVQRLVHDLRQTVNDLKSRHAESFFSYERIESDNGFETWVRLPKWVVDDLVHRIDRQKARRRSEFSKTGRLHLMSSRQCVTATLLFAANNWPWSRVAAAVGVGCQKTIENSVDLTLNVLIESFANDKNHVHFLTPKELYEDSWPLYGTGEMKGMALLCFDGTGTEIFSPLDTMDAKVAYCHWKSQHQLRWFLVVSHVGRILYFSGMYDGKMDDTAFDLCPTFWPAINHAYDVNHPLYFFTKADGTRIDVEVGCGGDAGYPYVKGGSHKKAVEGKNFGEMQWFITQTGEQEVRKQGDNMTEYEKNHPNVIFTPNYARARSVVDRVIGKLKRLSRLCGGPVYMTQEKKVEKVIELYCCVVNMMVDRNPFLFVNESGKEENDVDD